MDGLVFLPIIWLEAESIKRIFQWTNDEFAKRKIKWNQAGLKGILYKGTGKNIRVNIIELNKYYESNLADEGRKDG